MEFKCSHDIKGNILVVIPLEEKLDVRNSPFFKEKVLDLIHKTGFVKLVFDLHHLQFIDSSGLGSFLSIQRSLYKQSGKLKFAQLNPPVHTVFEIVSMNRIFDVFPTVEQAIKSF